MKPSALADALGVVLSSIAGFLSDLFLILAIMLFLLAEGSAMMDRLRASVPEDNPQVAGLIEVGHNVVRQFGLRAVVNLFTALGVTVLLLVLGVDFPLRLLGIPSPRGNDRSATGVYRACGENRQATMKGNGTGKQQQDPNTDPVGKEY